MDCVDYAVKYQMIDDNSASLPSFLDATLARVYAFLGDPLVVKPIKLDIGGGNCPVGEGYTIVDAYQTHNEDTLVAKAWKIPLPDGCVSEIYSSHMLEHLFNKDLAPTLTEWRRLLMPGGSLEIRVPSLEYCVREWLMLDTLDPEKWGFAFHRIFGGQLYDGDAHLGGFDQHRLEQLLLAAGFENPVISEYYCDKHQQAEIRADVVA